MTVEIEILEKLFTDFTEFIKQKDKRPFMSFRTSPFVDKSENYKYIVYDKAREELQNKLWKPEYIGTGKIQKYVSLAIQTRVYDNYETVENNLVNWRKKDDFTKNNWNRNLESIFFNFYKSKVSDQQSFENLIDEKLSYQFIAYLFFIKDRNRFLPISQEKFDEIFEILGITGFKTTHNVSWDNYTTFLDIIKQVRDFLKSKDNNVTLLDAHSFLWILGGQMKNEGAIIM